MTINAPELLASLKAEAEKQMALFPQYVGKFDRRVLVRIDRDITTKSGLAFSAGEYAMMRPDMFPAMSSYTDVWSMRNGCDTSIPKNAIQYIIERAGA